MRSRFEERTVAAAQALKGIAVENDRQRADLAVINATVTKYEAYMDNFRSLSDAVSTFNERQNNFSNRLGNMEKFITKIETSNLLIRINRLEDKFASLEKGELDVFWKIFRRINEEELNRRKQQYPSNG